MGIPGHSPEPFDSDARATNPIRNRIKDHRKVRAGDLVPHEWNFRGHTWAQQAALGAERKSMVGTGDRSEKIRTYNFPQNRVSDHRIGLTLHQLDFVMEGKMDAIFEALIAHYQGEKMKQQAEQGPVN